MESPSTKAQEGTAMLSLTVGWDTNEKGFQERALQSAFTILHTSFLCIIEIFFSQATAKCLVCLNLYQ